MREYHNYGARVARLWREQASNMSSGVYTALKSGAANAPSFEHVFDNYYSYVAKLAHTLLLNPQDAEDVTQEVFLRVHKSLSTFDPARGTLNSWLGKMTINACHTHRRRNFFHRLWGARHSGAESEPEDEVTALADSSPFVDPEDQALQTELRKAVKDVLAKMRPNHRAVLVLHHYMELSCAEIAQMMGCPEGTVHSRLHYARRVVQARLEDQLRLTKGEK